MKTINSIFILTAILLGTIPLQYSIAQQQDPILRFERCQECSNTLGNNHNTSMTIPQGGFNYNAPQDMESRNVASDFGRRGAPVSRWHMGVDINSQDETEGGNADAGDHILPIETGTVTAIKNLGATDGLKFIVIEGNHIFGYGHLFFDTNNANFPTGGQKCGDMILKKMDGDLSDEYAIIYNPTGGVPTAYSIAVGTVTHPDVNGGLPLTTTNQVTNLNIPIASMGNSGGNFGIHLHLYSFTINDPGMNDVFLNATYSANNHVRTAKDPLQIIEHDEPNYTVTINTDNLTYVETIGNSEEYSSIRVRCEMEGENSGTTYDDAVMNIDDVELFIKQKDESDDTYTYIRGVWLDSKISHGAVLAMGNEEATDRYPSPGFPSHNGHVNQTGDFPFRGVDIAHPNDTYGRGGRDISGINPSAYSGNPCDDFYFSDIKLRIHKDDNYNDTQIDYALVNQDARYPDGVYHLRAKATTVRGVEHYSDKVTPPLTPPDPVEIKVDNFRPYITYLKIEELAGNSPTLLYEADWISNGDFLCYGIQDSPTGNIKTVTDASSDILITLETSEAMTDVSLKVDDTGNGQGFYMTASNGDPLPMTLLNSAINDDKWQITIPYEEFPEFANGVQTLHITGHDKATTLNNLLGFSNNNGNNCLDDTQLPHRTGSSSWSIPFGNTDKIHIFEISDCVYNEGGNKKNGNDCLAEFTAHAFYPNQGSNFCNNNNPIPYVHPVNGGYFVKPTTSGRIFLDANSSIGVSDPLDPLNFEWYFYPDAPAHIGINPNTTGATQANGKTLSVDWTTPGDKVIELRIQCDGACSTKRINVAVAESPCTETKTPVFEPDQLAATDIVASFFHPAACEYVGQASCPNSANFNNGQIITNPHYYGASGCYELDVYEIVNGTQTVVVQNLYETGAYTLDCLEEGIYRVVMKDNVSACEIEQFVYLRDKNPVIAFDIAPVCDGNGDKAVVSAYIEEPLGCMTVVQVEGGGQGIGGSVIVTENQPINVYLGLGANQILYLQNQTIDIPEISQLSLNFTVTSTSGSNQCDGSIAPTASNGSGNYTYTVDGGSISGLCTGQHQLVATDTETNCSISTIFTVYAQINKPNNPDIIEVFTIHPNPFDDLVNISTTCDQLAPGDNSQIPVTISIYNSSGGHALTVYSGNLAPQQNHTFPVDVSNFSSGTYIFTIEALGQGESLMGIKN